MTLNYALLAGDYLQYYLFSASQNQRTMKVINRSRLLLGIALLVTGLVSYEGNRIFSVVLFILTIPAVLIFPYSIKRRYRNMYRKMTADKHRDADGEISTLIISEDAITTFDSQNHLRFDMAQLTKISEVGHYIYLHLKSGMSIIIPLQKTQQPDAVRSEMKILADRRQVPYVFLPRWKW